MRASRLLGAAAFATSGASVWAAAMSSGAPARRPRVTSKSEVGATKWVSLQTWKYEDAKGKERAWDVATRTTRLPDAEIDAVCILALLRSGSAPVETLLVQQFRPPLDGYTLELPAGLLDANESEEECALRELREETGFIGHSAQVTGTRLAMSPGMCEETVKLVVVDVDLDDARNAKPEQQLEESEAIKVVRAPLLGLADTIDEIVAREEGVVPIMGLYTLAVGLQQQQRLQSRLG